MPGQKRTAVRLVGKPDCGLCAQMREIVERVSPGYGLSLEDVDVRDDPELERRYVLEIPVLLLGEQEVVRHRVTEGDLRKRLEALGLAPHPP